MGSGISSSMALFCASAIPIPSFPLALSPAHATVPSTRVTQRCFQRRLEDTHDVSGVTVGEVVGAPVDTVGAVGAVGAGVVGASVGGAATALQTLGVISPPSNTRNE